MLPCLGCVKATAWSYADMSSQVLDARTTPLLVLACSLHTKQRYNTPANACLEKQYCIERKPGATAARCV